MLFLCCCESAWLTEIVIELQSQQCLRVRISWELSRATELPTLCIRIRWGKSVSSPWQSEFHALWIPWSVLSEPRIAHRYPFRLSSESDQRCMQAQRGKSRLVLGCQWVWSWPWWKKPPRRSCRYRVLHPSWSLYAVLRSRFQNFICVTSFSAWVRFKNYGSTSFNSVTRYVDLCILINSVA